MGFRGSGSGFRVLIWAFFVGRYKDSLKVSFRASWGFYRVFGRVRLKVS